MTGPTPTVPVALLGAVAAGTALTLFLSYAERSERIVVRVRRGFFNRAWIAGDDVANR